MATKMTLMRVGPTGREFFALDCEQPEHTKMTSARDWIREQVAEAAEVGADEPAPGTYVLLKDEVARFEVEVSRKVDVSVETVRPGRPAPAPDPDEPE